MVIGEFGGLQPDKIDNMAKAGPDDLSRQQTGERLFHAAADQPGEMQEELHRYIAEQRESAVEAKHLRTLLQNSPAEFVNSVTPYLDKQIHLGHEAQAWQHETPPLNWAQNFATQSQIGLEAQNIKNTIVSQGPDAVAQTLSDHPEVRQSVDLFLQQEDWLTGGR